MKTSIIFFTLSFLLFALSSCSKEEIKESGRQAATFEEFVSYVPDQITERSAYPDNYCNNLIIEAINDLQVYQQEITSSGNTYAIQLTQSIPSTFNAINFIEVCAMQGRFGLIKVSGHYDMDELGVTEHAGQYWVQLDTEHETVEDFYDAMSDLRDEFIINHEIED